MQINSASIPTLAIAFTRDLGIIGNTVAMMRGGKKAVDDIAFPSHAAIMTKESGYLFATEETIHGLRENSLEKYCRGSDNRIVAMYYWTGFDTIDNKNKATQYLTRIRSRGGRDSRYDYAGALSFIPIIGKWFFREDPEKAICSENCAKAMKICGAKWIKDTLIAPDELLTLMQKNDECVCVLNYYQ